MAAAEAAACAAGQGAFFPYHDALYARQTQAHNIGTFNRETLDEIAAEAGLDPDTFRVCMDGHRQLDTVEADRAEGQRRGVTGTPAVFINGQRIALTTVEDFLAQVRAAAGR